MTPIKINEYIKAIKKEIKTDLNVHCHNDFGMAVANSLAAYEAGVKCIDVTVNGLGERAGLASLSTTVAALQLLYGTNRWDLKYLNKISRMVERLSGVTLPRRQPIIGEDVFTHKGGLHAIAVLENPEVYEVIHPEAVGRHRKIVIGSYISRNVLAEYLRSMNPVITDQEIDKAYTHIKEEKQKDIIWEVDQVKM
jgi:isopropylmalate/homocitrate/citramalate synthase